MYWDSNVREDDSVFWKKSSKPGTDGTDKNGKAQADKTAAKSANAGPGKSAAKSKKAQTVKKGAANGAKKQAVKKPAADNVKKEDASDRVLAKLMAIEKETRLKQVRDNVDQLDDEKIAEHLESLLKSLRND